MKNCIGIFLSFILITLIVLPAHSRPQLVYMEDGIERIVGGLEGYKPYYTEPGEKKYLPLVGWYSIRNMDENILSWGYPPVFFTINRHKTSSSIDPEAPLPLNLTVSVSKNRRQSAWNMFRDNSLLRLWDLKSTEKATVFLAWYEPEINLLKIDFSNRIPYQNGELKHYATNLSIGIKSMKNDGFPILFVWKDSQFVPPHSFAEEYKDLFHSVIFGRKKMLLNKEIHASLLEKKDIFGNTPIHYAAAFGKKEILNLLLSQGANVNAKNKNRMTPLLLASAAGHDDIVQLLLQSKANINARDREGRTALHYASYNGYQTIVEKLLKHKAHSNTKDTFNWSPLLYAIDANHDSLVPLLAEHEKGNLRTDKENQQGVMVTNVMDDNLHIVSFLLGQRADANSEIVGTTPLIVAAGNSSLEMVDLLVTSGADVNKPNPKQITPLISACLTGRREVVKYLLEKNAKVNIQTPEGLSAIQAAVLRNDPEMIALLLSYGVDIEMTSKSGITPFWVAAGLGYRKSMITLLDAGARCDLDRKSAIDLMELAFRYDMPEAVKLALDQCLDPTFLFYDRYPSTWVAEYYGADEILDLLISRGAKRNEGESLNIASSRELLEGPKAKETTSIYYPEDLKRKHGSQRLLLKVLIDEEGTPLFPKMIDSDIPEIDKIVMGTVTKWRFTVPKRTTGEPCSIITKIPIVLTCEENEKDLWQLQEIDQPPEFVKKLRPKFPSDLRNKFLEGYATLALVVDEEGRPSDIKIKSMTHQGFGEAAIESVKKWKFAPAYYQGKPVKCSVSTRIIFSLGP